MQVHHNIGQLPLFRNAVITIGTFDGVHMGHRRIITKLKEEAAAINGETVIITFHPHPRKIVAHGAAPVRLINTLAEKQELLESLGIDHLVVVPFTADFSNQSAEDYIQNFLIEKFNPQTIIIGYDHRFGKGRSGNYLLLEEKALVYNYQLKEIPKHVLDEIAISSTKIRESLQEGDIAVAEKLLGYPFFVTGLILHGRRIGRTLGFPTANIDVVPKQIVPGYGVYGVRVQIKENRFSGVCNIGTRPTLDLDERSIEVHIDGFEGNIVGEEISVMFHCRLRDEIKFGSLEELIEQISKDIVTARKCLAAID